MCYIAYVTWRNVRCCLYVLCVSDSIASIACHSPSKMTPPGSRCQSPDAGLLKYPDILCAGDFCYFYSCCVCVPDIRVFVYCMSDTQLKRSLFGFCGCKVYSRICSVLFSKVATLYVRLGRRAGKQVAQYTLCTSQDVQLCQTHQFRRE